MELNTNEMKALILAAGRGTRLAPLTDNRPKSLVEVNGHPILFKQIENLYQNGIYDITIVSGYRAEMLGKTVHEKYPEVHIIESVNYASTNNMYSAYIAREAVEGHDFLMMNADVFYDASVVTTLLAFGGTNAFVTDIGLYMEESMKVVEREGRLIQIAKTVSAEEALGASIDVYKFSAEGGKAFFAKCAEYIEEKKEVKLWSEVALNDILGEVEFLACPINGRWFEIDNHDDLTAAERLFAVG